MGRYISNGWTVSDRPAEHALRRIDEAEQPGCLSALLAVPGQHGSAACRVD
jgi:hypothetical protein